jgi:hypothetical protein
MIPLPGLEILIWVVRICFGLFVISIAASFAAVRIARASWRAQRPATSSERLAVIVLVAGIVWFILLLPPFHPGVFVASLLPALISLGTLRYLRKGNRSRGLPSLGARGSVPVAVGSLAGCIVVLVATSVGIRQHQERERRLEEKSRAEGRAHQDVFAALAVTDRDVVVAGETSTPPASGDDAWVLTLDRSLALERRFSPVAPADQAFYALAANASGVIAGGRDDEHPVWLRLDAAGDTTARKVWPWDGAVRTLVLLEDGSALVAGSRDDAPFIARMDASGSERWSSFPDLKGSLRAAVTNGRTYLAAGSSDLPDLSDSSMVLAGGTTDGRKSWAMGFRASAFLPRPQAMVMPKPGAVLILGTTSDIPGRLEDLWLARISPDGALLDEHTFGGPQTDQAAGLAVHEGRVYVAAYKFIALAEELWLFEVDDHGDQVWEKTYPAKSHGRPAALAVTREGNLVVAGYREGADHHRDGWVAIFDAQGGLIAQRTYP